MSRSPAGVHVSRVDKVQSKIESFIKLPEGIWPPPPPPPQPATDRATSPAKIDATTAERSAGRILGERSARTLGWGKPMVMGWAFLTNKMDGGKRRRE